MTAAVLPAPRSITRLRTAGLVPAALALVVGIATWWAATPYVVGVFHDDGVYALLGKAIAEGRGFHYLQLPGAPAATHYPPLYPLVLGVLWWIAPSFPANLPFLLGFNGACVVASSLGLFFLLRRRFGWPAVAAAATSAALHAGAPMLTLASALLSEPLFLALLWPTLLLAERAAEHEHSSTLAVVGAAVFAGVLASCRVTGLAAIVALPIALCLSRRWRPAAIAAGASTLVLLPWLLWTLVAAPTPAAPLRGAYGAYSSFVASGVRGAGAALFVRVGVTNGRELALSTVDRVAPGLPPIIGVAAMGLLAIAFAAGCWRLSRRSRVIMIFVALYLLMVLANAFAPWRFLWALWPLLVVVCVEGARHVVERMPTRAAAAAAAGLFSIPAAGMLLTEARSLASGDWRVPARRASSQVVPLVAWVRANTAPADVVLAEGAEVVTLFTGRRAAPPVEFAAADYVLAPDVARTARSLSAMMTLVPATHLVSISPLTIAAARRIARGRPALEEIGTFEGGVAFRIAR